jgi:hypothetical protein
MNPIPPVEVKRVFESRLARARHEAARPAPPARRETDRTAQAAGQDRRDATTQDFGVVLVMVAAVMDAGADVDSEL